MPDAADAAGSVVGWLRAGYPDGVPSRDYLALLGILQRALTPAEIERVVESLASDAEESGERVTHDQVEQGVAEVVRGQPRPEDVVRVSARLAAAGWPLASPHVSALAPPEPPDTERTGVVTKVVDWLRTGYPDEVPETDSIPLVALLRPPPPDGGDRC